MTADNDDAPEVETEAVAALRGAMEASTAKDKAITRALETINEALRRFKWATRRNLVVLVLLIGIVGYGAHEYSNFSSRSDANQKLLLCLAKSDETLTNDLNLFANTHGDARHYPNASSCTHLAKK